MSKAIDSEDSHVINFNCVPRLDTRINIVAWLKSAVGGEVIQKIKICMDDDGFNFLEFSDLQIFEQVFSVIAENAPVGSDALLDACLLESAFTSNETGFPVPVYSGDVETAGIRISKLSDEHSGGNIPLNGDIRDLGERGLREFKHSLR